MPEADASWPAGVDAALFLAAVGGLCAYHRVPFDAELLRKHFPVPRGAESVPCANWGFTRSCGTARPHACPARPSH